MKFFLPAIILLSLFVCFSGCSSDSATDDNAEVEIEDTVHDVFTPGGDSAIMVKNSPFLWHADFEETTNTYKIKAPAEKSLDTLSGASFVNMINNDWDSIHVDYLKTSHDTIYLNIRNSDYLTQRVGSSGAENFLATTTYSLTEVKGIRFVNFKFKSGDHATPGTYSREDFRTMDH